MSKWNPIGRTRSNIIYECNCKCCICGKTALGFEKIELVKTKRKYYICFHRECYDKLPKVKGSAVME